MSSKKQEIADSWEDIDEEQLAITILKNSTSIDGDKADSTNSSAVPGNTARQNSLPQMLEEELRPRILPRPMQILKRPQTSGGSEGKSAADSKPKTQIKSLDQRKQAYAEARLRILGSAHDDEEADTKKTTPTTNGYRINNVNNNVGSSGNASSNATSTGGGSSGGEGMSGNGANNNSNNLYRYYPPYRQQAPIGTFPSAMQNGPQGRGQGTPVVYYPTTPNHNPHHPMHSPLTLHPYHTLPPMPQHHPLHPQQPPHQQQQQQQQQPQQPHGAHPYQHQQHFAQHPNHQQPAGRDGGWYGVGRNGGNVTLGYHGGNSKGYGEGNGPLSPSLLSYGLASAFPNHGISYNSGGAGAGATFGKPNSHGSSGGSNITTTNQHVLRLPAGPDGSQGFNMRR